MSNTAGRRIARARTDLMDTLVLRVKMARREATERRERLESVRRGPSVQERQTSLIRFYERYEHLVETLCDAAQYGPTPKLARSYESNREAFRNEYLEIRPFLLSFVAPDAGMDECDPFEMLVAAEDLTEFLSMDDGGMISRITRTREALVLYGEHLRQLAGRTA